MVIIANYIASQSQYHLMIKDTNEIQSTYSIICLLTNVHIIQLAITMKCSQIQSQSIYFKSFPGGMPADPLALACYAC